MNKLSTLEKVLYIFLLCLIIFTFGVQLGIKHGRDIEKQEILNDY